MVMFSHYEWRPSNKSKQRIDFSTRIVESWEEEGRSKSYQGVAMYLIVSLPLQNTWATCSPHDLNNQTTWMDLCIPHNSRILYTVDSLLEVDKQMRSNYAIACILHKYTLPNIFSSFLRMSSSMPVFIFPSVHYQLDSSCIF